MLPSKHLRRYACIAICCTTSENRVASIPLSLDVQCLYLTWHILHMRMLARSIGRGMSPNLHSTNRLVRVARNFTLKLPCFPHLWVRETKRGFPHPVQPTIQLSHYTCPGGNVSARVELSNSSSHHRLLQILCHNRVRKHRARFRFNDRAGIAP